MRLGSPRATTAIRLALAPLLTMATALAGGQAPLPASGAGRPSVASGLKHVVAIRTDGMVVTWGANEVGQLGRGTTDAVNVRRPPDVVPGVTTAIAASAGDDFTLLLLVDGTVLSWGDNAEGQLGHGPMGVLPRPGQPMRPASTPAPVVGLAGVTQVAAGARFALALREDGTVVAWGDGQLGALGDGKGVGGTSHYAVPFPRPVAGLSNVTAIAAGASFALALRDDGSVWGWGASQYGQLGDGRSEFMATPAPLPAVGPARSVHAAGDTALALRSDGSVVAWGKNDGGLLDAPESKLPRSPTPVPIRGLAGVRQLATSSMAGSVLAVMPDGGVRAWGDNAYSQISNGPVVDGKVVVPVKGVAAVATGGARSLFVMPDGRLLTTGFRMADLVDRVPREVARLDPATETRCAAPAGGPAGSWRITTDVVARARPASKADVTAALARAADFERLLTVLPSDATLNESRGSRFIRDATPALGDAMAFGVRGQFLLSRCEAGSGRLEEIGSTRSTAAIVANDLAGLLDTFGPPLPRGGGEVQLYQVRRQEGTVGGWSAFRTSQGRAVLVTRAGEEPFLTVSRGEFLDAFERHVLARSTASAGAMTDVVTQITRQIARLRTEPPSDTRDTVIAQMEKALEEAKQQTAANTARVEAAAGDEVAVLRRYREGVGAGDLARPAVLSAFAFQGQFADDDAEGARPVVRLNPDYFSGRPRHQAQMLLVVWDWAAGHPQDEAWRSWFESAFPFDRLQALLAP